MSTYLEKSKIYKGFHYSVLEFWMIEYLHKRTLEMFSEVIKILQRNNIQYMVCGGTLLGSITNGSFIPWDDDLDICIFEEDYERAIDCLVENLDGSIAVQCVKTDPNYYIGWTKIRDRFSRVFPDCPQFKENGVWIDIYKLMYIDKREIEYLASKESIDYLNRRLSAEGINKDEYQKRINEGMLLAKLSMAEERMLSNTNHDKAYMIWSASKVVLEEDWVYPLQEVCFEGICVTTFRQATKYLEQHYGANYLELPPYELRRVGINRIDLYENNLNI